VGRAAKQARALRQNVEKRVLEIVLAKAGGNQTAAAEMLGINRNRLRKKMQEHEIKA
jgi:Fis family transcriptional regulator